MDLMQQVPAAILLVVRTLLRCNMHEQKERERGRRVAGGQTTTPRWRSRSRLQQLCIDGPLLCNLLGGGEVTITPSWLNSKAGTQGFNPNCPAKFNLCKSQAIYGAAIGPGTIFAQAPGLQSTAKVCDEPDGMDRATPDGAAFEPEFEGTSSASPGRWSLASLAFWR